MYKIYIKKTTRLDERYQDKIKLRYSLCLWTEGPNIVKISVLPKLVYRFKAIPIKVPESCEAINKLTLKSVWGFPWWSSGYDSVLPMQEAWVQSLVREQRSHMLHDMAK